MSASYTSTLGRCSYICFWLSCWPVARGSWSKAFTHTLAEIPLVSRMKSLGILIRYRFMDNVCLSWQQRFIRGGFQEIQPSGPTSFKRSKPMGSILCRFMSTGLSIILHPIPMVVEVTLKKEPTGTYKDSLTKRRRLVFGWLRGPPALFQFSWPVLIPLIRPGPYISKTDCICPRYYIDVITQTEKLRVVDSPAG